MAAPRAVAAEAEAWRAGNGGARSPSFRPGGRWHTLRKHLHCAVRLQPREEIEMRAPFLAGI